MNTQSALLAKHALAGALLGQQYEGAVRYGREWDMELTVGRGSISNRRKNSGPATSMSDAISGIRANVMEVKK